MANNRRASKNNRPSNSSRFKAPSRSVNSALKVGAEIDVTVERYSSSGMGIAKASGEVIFVEKAICGEAVTIKLRERKRKTWFADIKQITQSSSHRVTPDCQYYGQCGGCDLQHMSYDHQLEFKQQRVAHEFERQKLTPCWDDILYNQPWHYRRRARISVRYNKAKNQHFIGFRESASSHVQSISHCMVLMKHPVLEMSQWHSCFAQLEGKDKITHMDILMLDNVIMISLRVLKALSRQDQHQLINWLKELVSGVDVLPVELWQQSEKGQLPTKIGDTAHGLSVENLAAHYHVFGLRLDAHVSDFVQVNSVVNENMVQQAIKWLAPNESHIIYDLFAGHGNFSLPLAKSGAEVVAVELQSSMVTKLQNQADKLALSLYALVADLSGNDGWWRHKHVDIVLLDPPRAGAAEACKVIATQKVGRILYVACDAATMARDVRYLCDHGYQIKRAGIMDMFPQTHHVETMMLLEYRGK